MTERASRLDLPEVHLVDVVVAARADVLLAGPPEADEDPSGFLLGIAELVRMGDLAGGDVADLAPDIAGAVHEIAARPGWDVDAALAAAALVLATGDDRRAVGDVARIVARRPAPAPAPPDAEGIRAVAAVERTLAAGPVLFPAGIPAAWRGVNLEAHGLPAGPRRRCPSPCGGTASTRPCCGRSPANPSSSPPPPSTPPGAREPPGARRSGAHPADVRQLFTYRTDLS